MKDQSQVQKMRQDRILALMQKPLTHFDEVLTYAEQIQPSAAEAAGLCKNRWRDLCKPLYSLGRLEDYVRFLAEAQATASPRVDRRAVFLFAGDNGIVHEGVSQCGQEVTVQVLRNMNLGRSSVQIFAKQLNCDFMAVDLGSCEPVSRSENVLPLGIMPGGTKNFLYEEAMTEETVCKAISAGIAAVEVMAQEKFEIMAAGEMGIGNTSSSTALIAALTGRDVRDLSGRGAGLSDSALEHKKTVLHRALVARQTDASNPLDCLKKVGGLDIAAICGFYLAAARNGIPILLDGLISAAAALLVMRLNPRVKDYLIPVHKPREQASGLVFAELGREPTLDLNLSLGEGAGALTLLPLLDLALAEYREMPSFAEGKVETYEDFTAAQANPKSALEQA